MLSLLAAAIIAAPPSQSEVTVYNQGFSLVKETRLLHLKEGRQSVAIEDVASMIDPSSVSIQSLTDGMSWNSDYVLTLDGTGKAALQGWVTINNQSGATYENAKLKLLAGDVNVPAPSGRAISALNATRAGEERLGGFQEQGLFEY